MFDRLRFSKQNRLCKPAQFQTVFKARQRVGNSFFVIYYLPNQLPYFRLGLVMSKRNAKRAVVRNYLKRIIREHFRLNQATLVGFDFVVVGNKAAGTAGKDQLHPCLDSLLQRLSKLSHKA